MRIEPGEHIAVIGVTRSGKTWFVRDHLIPVYPYIVVYDTKRQDPWTEWLQSDTVWSIDGLKRSLQMRNNRIHYAAKPKDRETRIQETNEICEILLKVGGYCLVIDEASHVMSSSFIPRSLEKYMTSSAGVGGTCIVGSQRPTKIIHPTVVSQCIHIFMGFISPREHTSDLKRWLPLEYNPPFRSYQFVYVGPEGRPCIIGGYRQ